MKTLLSIILVLFLSSIQAEASCSFQSIDKSENEDIHHSNDFLDIPVHTLSTEKSANIDEGATEMHICMVVAAYVAGEALYQGHKAEVAMAAGRVAMVACMMLFI